jgi:ribonuclease VapC
MIVDSSAIVAILLREPGYEQLLDCLAADENAGIGAPTLAETGIVLVAKMGLMARTLLARFVDEAELIVVPFDDDHWQVATDAFVRFGKGLHSAAPNSGAALNFGDCMTYAVARLADEPLLYVGNDFVQTDLRSALATPH